MSKADKDLLDQLHGLMAKTMKNKLESGEVTASDLNVIRQFLKDNGIEALASPDSPMGELAKAWEEAPFQDDSDLLAH